MDSAVNDYPGLSLHIPDAYDLLSREAGRVPAGSEGLVFIPAMQGAMAPEWNGSARGVFYGLTLAHSRAHMTRAILEGSAFGLRDILEATVRPPERVRLGSLLASIAREAGGLTAAEARRFDRLRDKRPAEPIGFE